MGMLVAFEGANGVGKTTTIEALKPLLAQAGIKVESMSYPCFEASCTGSVLRASLSSKQGGFYESYRSGFKKFADSLDQFEFGISRSTVDEWSRKIENASSTLKGKIEHTFLGKSGEKDAERSLLFALNRYETKVELENLVSNSDLVILDRYIGSNLAYNFEKKNFLLTLETSVLGMLTPDLNILLDTSGPIECFGNMDVYESSKSVQADVIQRYRDLVGSGFGDWTWKVVQIDMNGKRKTKELIIKEVRGIIMDKLNGSKFKKG